MRGILEKKYRGKIEQKGTHRELITEGGEYARLWEFQKGGFVE